MPLRVVFFGTPEIAVPTLARLVEIADVKAVVAQPDRPKGRGQKLAAPPTKVLASLTGIPVLQPLKMKDPELWARLAAFDADLFVVVAYGRILPPQILSIPGLGCVNVHASLLPRYRGAAPIQWAILRGEKETGVTLMLMDEGLDTGPMLARRSTPIGPDETSGELGVRLGLLGAQLVADSLPDIEHGRARPEPQDSSLATMAPLLEKAQGRIRFEDTAQRIHDHVRALNPWPGAFTTLDDRTLKVHRTRPAPGTPADLPGRVVAAGGDGIWVACTDGAIVLREVQLEGKKRMSAAEFASGARLKQGRALY
ncbi:MAG: methionyl-tRNA formyltransferase [Deltaproteobacteria bacterium]|nr:methionyl-tRNA formyltransferase [Deltaproteobacteria bacterium]